LYAYAVAVEEGATGAPAMPGLAHPSERDASSYFDGVYRLGRSPAAHLLLATPSDPDALNMERSPALSGLTPPHRASGITLGRESA
jgi:hypothetical protein